VRKKSLFAGQQRDSVAARAKKQGIFFRFLLCYTFIGANPDKRRMTAASAAERNMSETIPAAALPGDFAAFCSETNSRPSYKCAWLTVSGLAGHSFLMRS
jgi:hypothetical protein